MIYFGRIYDDIYKQNINLAYGGDSEEFINFLKKQHDVSDKDIELLWNSKGCYFVVDGYNYIWISKKKKSEALEILVHELFHFVVCKLSDLGIRLTVANHEPHAYYYEYLHPRILKEIERLIKK